MKGVTITLVMTSVALGGLGAYLYKRLDDERLRADREAALRVKLESRVKQLELAASEFTSNVAADVVDTVAPGTSGAVAAMGPNAADPAAPGSVPGDVRQPRRQFNPYDTPGGRDMMRLQSRISSKQNYGDLLEQLKLDPQQAQQFMNLLVDQQEREMQAFQQQQRGDRAGFNQVRKEMQTQAQAEVASLFGGQTADAFAKYQATLGERRQVSYMAEQLGALDLPMSDDQKERLIALMAEEKTNLPEPEVNYRDPDSRNAHADWYEQYNRSVLSRASSVLSSDQYRRYSELQEWQLNTQRMFRVQRPRDRTRPPRN